MQEEEARGQVVAPTTSPGGDLPRPDATPATATPATVTPTSGTGAGTTFGPPEATAIPAVVQERLLAYLQHTSDLLGVTDDQGNVVWVNEATRRRLGLGPDDHPALTTADLFPPSVFDTYYDEIRPTVLRGEVWSGALPIRGEDGEVLPAWLTVVGGAAPGGEVAWLVTSGRDLSESLPPRDELAWRATHDDLTGAASRLLLRDRLDRALARARRSGSPVAVMFIDVDHLKELNDRYGHKVGDAVLTEVAHRLQAAVRTSDTVARVGGDEFVVVLDGVHDEDEGLRMATRVEAVLDAEAIVAGSTPINPMASVGVVITRGDEDPETVLRTADAAMYEVKRSRSGRTGDSPRVELPMAATAHQVAVAVTQTAIVPWYQPVVDAGSGRLAAHQALARWERDGEPTLAAADFIPLVDRTGVGFSLDLAVLRHCAAEAAGWTSPRPEGPGAGVTDASAAPAAPPTVAVHITSAFLLRPGADQFVHEVLDHAGLPPDRLELVLSPWLLTGRGDAHRSLLPALRALGVTLSAPFPLAARADLAALVPDVVSGVRLRLAPVAPGGDHLGPVAGLEPAIAWAEQAGLAVTVTGVEHDAQRDRLVDAGCARLLGHRFGRPRPGLRGADVPRPARTVDR